MIAVGIKGVALYLFKSCDWESGVPIILGAEAPPAFLALSSTCFMMPLEFGHTGIHNFHRDR